MGRWSELDGLLWSSDDLTIARNVKEILYKKEQERNGMGEILSCLGRMDEEGNLIWQDKPLFSPGLNDLPHLL